MAEIFLARHGEVSGLRKLVVVKRILPHLAAEPKFINMFLDEARITSTLDHPNVAHIFEVSRSGNEFFLIMELVQGESLATLLAGAEKVRQPVPHGIIGLIAAQAAAGLHHAHTACDPSGAPMSVVHRDVSPHNILISFEGTVKLIDFGIARALQRTSTTQAGNVKGTCAYMSPEQAHGEPLDARSDVFALGVVLWEGVCGRRLFARESDLATLHAIVDERTPRPSEFGAVDPALEQIVMRALERDRARRFSSAQEMQVALEKFLVAGGGVSTVELARYVTELLPHRHQRWKQALRVAHEEEPMPEDPLATPVVEPPSAIMRIPADAIDGAAETGFDATATVIDDRAREFAHDSATRREFDPLNAQTVRAEGLTRALAEREAAIVRSTYTDESMFTQPRALDAWNVVTVRRIPVSPVTAEIPGAPVPQPGAPATGTVAPAARGPKHTAELILVERKRPLRKVLLLIFVLAGASGAIVLLSPAPAGISTQAAGGSEVPSAGGNLPSESRSTGTANARTAGAASTGTAPEVARSAGAKRTSVAPSPDAGSTAAEPRSPAEAR